ncbi:hypothetical protein Hdeb2414_s0022g00611171 [Helianthus debilis subsp. tardiflorus]
MSLIFRDFNQLRVSIFVMISILCEPCEGYKTEPFDHNLPRTSSFDSIFTPSRNHSLSPSLNRREQPRQPPPFYSPSRHPLTLSNSLLYHPHTRRRTEVARTEHGSTGSLSTITFLFLSVRLKL